MQTKEEREADAKAAEAAKTAKQAEADKAKQMEKAKQELADIMTKAKEAADAEDAAAAAKVEGADEDSVKDEGAEKADSTAGALGCPVARSMVRGAYHWRLRRLRLQFVLIQILVLACLCYQSCPQCALSSA